MTEKESHTLGVNWQCMHRFLCGENGMNLYCHFPFFSEMNGVGDNCADGGIPLPLDDESLGLEDEEEEEDKWSNFNEDGSFIGCYGQGDKTDNASSMV